MAIGDVVLTCRDCDGPFNFTADERGRMAEAGRSHPPSRCPNCRAARKARQEQTGGVRAAPGFRERRVQPTTTSTTTCAACGKPAVVPFVLRTDRVAYCSPCFEQRRESPRSETGR
jgi:CxxC-x17-CxxC domain-containing protein